jgi:uncharacterized repeat protein (TIGR01451 family)
MKLSLSILASTAILLAVTGCADFRMPRLDPSGEHLFIVDPPPVTSCPPGTIPAPVAAPPAVIPPAAAPPAVAPAAVPSLAGPSPASLPVVSPYSDVAVTLSPFRVVEAVGSQVPMVAGVRGGDNYLRTNRRLEWWIMPGSVGQFTAIGQNNFADFLLGDYTHPRITSATSAVGSTTRVAQRAGGPGTSVNVVSGQGWVTVSSPVEGVTHVTVVAPEVVLPGERTKTATIYWVDAGYGFPSPAIAPAGSKQALTTTVWRQTNHSPRPGWIVRYEVACGPAALFGPAGTPSIEVATNEAGQAPVEIFQKDPSPGTNQVRLQVFRPADACGERAMVKEGSVLVTWTAPSLGIRQSGPSTAAFGATITYRIDVSNPGDLPARDVVASDEVPEGLSFVEANPAAVVEGRRLQWRLGDLAPRQAQSIEATFRPQRDGLITHCVEVTAAGGLRSGHCATTNVLAALPGPATVPAPATPVSPPVLPPSAPVLSGPPAVPPAPSGAPVLDLKITPESQAVVGSDLTFDIDVANRGTATAKGVVILDTFGEGLEHSKKSPISVKLGDLAPGQVLPTFSVTFRITKAGRLCHRIEVTAANGGQAMADSCVTAVLPAGGTGPAVTAPPGTTAVTPPPTAPVAVPLQVQVSALATSMVGKSVLFSADIANPGKQPVANITVACQTDAALFATDGTEGAEKKGNDVVWSLPSIPAGGSVRIQVRCDCKQAAATACCRFTAAPANGPAADGRACLAIAPASPATVTPTPPAAAAGRLSVLVDNRNIVTAGKPQQFEIQVTNQGDLADSDIVVTAQLPPGSTVAAGTRGPSPDITFTQPPGLIRFSPVAALPPKMLLIYRVVVTTSAAGPITLEALATSHQQTQAVAGKKTIEVLP